MLNQLLTTKLYVPPLRATLIPRDRLVQQLEDALPHTPLILIAAPAGFGKTTLLSEWLNASHHNAAWVSLDDSDNDPARFLAYCTAALQTIVTELGEGVLAGLQSTPLPPIPSLLTSLLNEIATEDETLILILDDYHIIASEKIHEALLFLVEYAPPNLHLVLTTRTDPPLPLARLRARGQLLEIRANELRFTSQEIRAFFEVSTSQQLQEDTINFLHEKTEGWAAGLQLTALSLRGRTEVETFLHDFRGNNRYILSYLVDEVLSAQPETVQQFLLRTAVLERLCAPLCDALTGQSNSHEMLDHLMDSNLFIVPLDTVGEWYRYHHLFADVLRQRLTQHLPEIVPELHHRARLWFEQQGSTEDAIHHALAAHDVNRAGALLASISRDLLKYGNITTLQTCLSALPCEIIRAIPDLSLAYGWLNAMRGRGQFVREYAGAAEQALESAPLDEQTRLQGELAALQVQIAMSEGDLPRTIELGEHALTSIVEDDPNMRGIVALNLGSAYRLTGHMIEAETAYKETLRLAQQSGSLLQTVYALHNLAALYEICADLDRAFDHYRQITQLAEGSEGVLPTSGLGNLGMGKVLRERNQLEEAEAQLHKAVHSGRRHRMDGVIVDGCITLALVRMGQRDWQTAQAYLNEAREVAQHWQQSNTLLRLRTFEARFALLRGDLPTAQRWMGETGVSVDNQPTDNDSAEQIMLARLLLAQNQHPQALAYLERLLLHAEADGRTTKVIETLNLQALAHDALSEDDRAYAALDRALTLAQPGGFVRVFLDEDERLIALLRQIASGTGKSAAFAQTILTSSQQPLSAPGQSSASDLIESLSERELEVLQLIASGLTNQEIADRLVLAKSTVKKHIENIFGKLFVNNRTHAVSRAQELGLI
jgi:LuxR family transcriptional regulator, maltose regulon positive regulatory protein